MNINEIEKQIDKAKRKNQFVSYQKLLNSSWNKLETEMVKNMIDKHNKVISKTKKIGETTFKLGDVFAALNIKFENKNGLIGVVDKK